MSINDRFSVRLPEFTSTGRRIMADDDGTTFSVVRSERTFAARLTSIALARNFVRLFALHWPFSGPRLSDIELATSELATNAIVHGCGESFTIELEGSRNGFVVRVISIGALTLPQIRRPSSFERTGRGLLIVSQVGDNLSAIGDRLGVTMSCQFDLERREHDAGPMAYGAVTASTTSSSDGKNQ